MIGFASTTEVRTARPVFFGAGEGMNLAISVMKGSGRVANATAVKVQRLAKGGYSIRTLGKGGFGKTLHVKASTSVVMVDRRDGGLIFGTIEDIFNAHTV